MKTKQIFTVRRNRGSVTQGTATVLLNGLEVITFADSITLLINNKSRGKEYGQVIGGWQSEKKDIEFIKGVKNPFFTNADKINKRLAEIEKYQLSQNF